VPTFSANYDTSAARIPFENKFVFRVCCKYSGSFQTGSKAKAGRQKEALNYQYMAMDADGIMEGRA
jgi:hypothetical protein